MSDTEATGQLLAEPELTEIFAADPCLLDDMSFRKLVLHYRAERKTFVALEAKPKATKAKAAPKTAPPPVVSLGDLGLD